MVSEEKVIPVVDAHLDLAENVTIFGRDLTKSVAEIRGYERRGTTQATVSLPDLERGGITVVFATVTPGFKVEDVGKADFVPPTAIYETPEEAEAQALGQIALYESWQHQGRVRLLKSVADLEHHLELWKEDGKPGLVLLMESADAIVRVLDLKNWWQRGLRMLSLTYGDTRYVTGVAGGGRSFKGGGLTHDGVAMLVAMEELGMTWDISHLAEDGIWQGLELGHTRVIASHANSRTLTPTDRHLSDDIIRAIAERDGVIGLVLYNGFLEPKWKKESGISVTLDQHLRRQAAYIAELVGWEHIGIGSDLDGGFGLEESPAEIDTVADLYKVGEVVPPEVRDAVLGRNWLTFLRKTLPG